MRGLWDDPAASEVLKKRVLRTVVEEIVVRDDEARLNHLLAIHWKGGVHTELTVARTQIGRKANDCGKTVLSLIEDFPRFAAIRRPPPFSIAWGTKPVRAWPGAFTVFTARDPIIG